MNIKYYISLMIISGNVLCNNSISAASKIQEIKSIDQYDKAAKSQTPAVFMYCSNHCAPCRTMKPNFLRAAQEFPNVAFYMVNTSIGTLGSLMTRNNIFGLPTVTYVRNGREIRRDRKGAMPYHEIKQGVNEFLKTSTKDTKNNQNANIKKVTGNKSETKNNNNNIKNNNSKVMDQKKTVSAEKKNNNDAKNKEAEKKQNTKQAINNTPVIKK